MALTSSQAEQIADDALSTIDKILAMSIMDTWGNTITAKSKESFKQAFEVTTDRDKYGGTLAIAALGVANDLEDIVGEAQAIIAIYKDCKMMLLPIPAYQIMVGFVLERSTNAEDENIANEIERLVADTIIKFID
jgi:hypothetical protein